MDNAPQENPNIQPASPETALAQKSHSILPITLIVIGILETLYFSLQLLVLIITTRKLAGIYQKIETEPTITPLLGIVLIATLLIFALAQTYYGFWLKKLINNENILPSKHKKIAIFLILIILIFALFSMYGLVFSVLAPIYHLTAQF